MNHLIKAATKLSLFTLLLAFAGITTAQAQETVELPAPDHTPSATENPELVKKYQATITESDLASHLYVFASDYFEGRETAHRGQKLAAYYLAGQYRKMGITPSGTMEVSDDWAPENYFQSFPLFGSRLQKAEIKILSKGKVVGSSEFGIDKVDGHSYLPFGSVKDVAGEVVFAGYGISDSKLEYDDFKAVQDAGIDISDKWVMVMNGEPLESAEKSLLPTEDGKPSSWTTGRNKLRHLFSMGARGYLIVGDVGPLGSDIAEAASANAPSAESLGRLSLVKPKEGGGRQIPPFYMISSELANKILAPSKKTISKLQKKIDGSLKPEVFVVKDIQVNSGLTNEVVETSSENVAAFIEGSDPALKHEVVVVSSHYDHIGINPGDDSEDRINNGADDDGSGTVAVLEIAEAFKQAVRDGNGPRRSILFLNVSGEEKGLLGSAYYSDTEPIFPVENTVANLNIDMVGRFDPTHPSKSENYVYIIGSNLISQQLHDLNAEVNTLTGINLELDERFNSKDDPNQFYRRSDHWNFGKHNIPFIFFFTGTHEDYHGVDDEAEKIEYPRMKRIAQLIFATAWQVANQDERPPVTGGGFN